MNDVEIQENGNIRLPMACLHGEDGEVKMDALRQCVRDIFELNDDRYLVTNILYGLNSWFKGRSFDIERVHVDQWMSVGVEEFVYGEMEHGDKGRVIYAHCDSFEDGLAKVFLYIYDNFERYE